MHLLAQGDIVVGCARSPATIDHDCYRHIQADVTKEPDVEELFRNVRKFEQLDVLINNAGTARMLPLALTPDDTARRIIDLNLLATFRMIHRAVRLLRKSRAARIVNLTSVAVPLRLAGETIYAASKAAVEMLTRVVAKELGPLGITCNAIGPTPIRTDLIRNVPEDKLNAIISQQSIPVWAESADVANVVDFFLRPESRLITGQVIYLGGMG
jgi:3-oxoacyl-[acyl-carrier protein] reductase